MVVHQYSDGESQPLTLLLLRCCRDQPVRMKTEQVVAVKEWLPAKFRTECAKRPL